MPDISVVIFQFNDFTDFVWYSLYLRWAQKKKSNAVRIGDLADISNIPLRPVHLYGRHSFGWSKLIFFWIITFVVYITENIPFFHFETIWFRRNLQVFIIFQITLFNEGVQGVYPVVCPMRPNSTRWNLLLYLSIQYLLDFLKLFFSFK